MGLFSFKTLTGNLPLEQMRFDETDIFALLGGTDTGLLACPLYATPQVPEGGDLLAKCKQRLAHRYEQSGYVDADGNPCEELAQIIYPLNKPGQLLADGDLDNGFLRTAPDGGDDRRWAVVVYEGCASAVVRAPGFRGGFYLRSLGDRDQWEERFLELSGFGKTFEYATVDSETLLPGEVYGKTLDAFGAKGEAIIRDIAKKYDADPNALLSAAGIMQTASYQLAPGRPMTAVDYRGCTFGQVAAAGDRNVPTKHMMLKEKNGFATEMRVMPAKGDPNLHDDANNEVLAERSIGGFNLIGKGSLFDRLIETGWYPDHFGEQLKKEL